MQDIGIGRFASLTGRYYAMDRDQRWDRTQKTYQAMVQGVGLKANSITEAFQQSYLKNEGDEFIQPYLIPNQKQELDLIQNGDGIIFFNFRADRARQITRAFTQQDSSGFSLEKRPKLAGFVCFTEYDATFDLPIAFHKAELTNILGAVVSQHGLKQLRIAETEKYAHVTFFFNGGKESQFNGEERILIPSPRDVATYDQKPEMSALELTHKLVDALKQKQFDLIISNYANPDMVGHTGNFEAAVKACECIDRCLEQVVNASLEQNGWVLITADHGNIEAMRDNQGQPITAHSTNPVPLVLISKEAKNMALKSGIPADLAPTILDILNIEKPPQMTGHSLIIKN